MRGAARRRTGPSDRKAECVPEPFAPRPSEAVRATSGPAHAWTTSCAQAEAAGRRASSFPPLPRPDARPPRIHVENGPGPHRRRCRLCAARRVRRYPYPDAVHLRAPSSCAGTDSAGQRISAHRRPVVRDDASGGPSRTLRRTGATEGCWFRYDPGGNFVLDTASDAPESPPGILRIRFPLGLEPGYSPGLFQVWSTPGKA